MFRTNSDQIWGALLLLSVIFFCLTMPVIYGISKYLDYKYVDKPMNEILKVIGEIATKNEQLFDKAAKNALRIKKGTYEVEK